MKILGEANYRALAKNNSISEVQLRGDPKKLLIPPNIDLASKTSLLVMLLSSSNSTLTKNKIDLIKITSQ